MQTSLPMRLARGVAIIIQIKCAIAAELRFTYIYKTYDKFLTRETDVVRTIFRNAYQANGNEYPLDQIKNQINELQKTHDFYKPLYRNILLIINNNDLQYYKNTFVDELSNLFNETYETIAVFRDNDIELEKFTEQVSSFDIRGQRDLYHIEDEENKMLNRVRVKERLERSVIDLEERWQRLRQPVHASIMSQFCNFIGSEDKIYHLKKVCESRSQKIFKLLTQVEHLSCYQKPIQKLKEQLVKACTDFTLQSLKISRNIKIHTNRIHQEIAQKLFETSYQQILPENFIQECNSRIESIVVRYTLPLKKICDTLEKLDDIINLNIGLFMLDDLKNKNAKCQPFPDFTFEFIDFEENPKIQLNNIKANFLSTKIDNQPLAPADICDKTTFQNCRRIYLDAAKKYHPDKHCSDQKKAVKSTILFQNLEDAWSTFIKEIKDLLQENDVDVGSKEYLTSLDKKFAATS